METYMTYEELSGYLRISEQTLRCWVDERKIPFRTKNGDVRFRVSEIELWIENGSVEDSTYPVLDVISLDELREEEEAQEVDCGEME